MDFESNGAWPVPNCAEEQPKRSGRALGILNSVFWILFCNRQSGEGHL